MAADPRAGRRLCQCRRLLRSCLLPVAGVSSNRVTSLSSAICQPIAPGESAGTPRWVTINRVRLSIRVSETCTSVVINGSHGLPSWSEMNSVYTSRSGGSTSRNEPANHIWCGPSGPGISIRTSRLPPARTSNAVTVIVAQMPIPFCEVIRIRPHRPDQIHRGLNDSRSITTCCLVSRSLIRVLSFSRGP